MLKFYLLVALVAVQFMNSQQCTPYTVQAGDNCWSIWTAAKISDANFYAYNPDIRCDLLKVGQVVCLSPQVVATTYAPTAAPTVQVFNNPFTSCTQAHVVQSGQHCWDIMGQYNLAPQTFIGLNPYIDCNNMPVGSLVCVALVVTTIPPPTTTTVVTVPPPLCKSSMVVQPGDTCGLIMRFKGITLDELLRINPGLDCNNLQAGSLVCLEAFPVVATTLAPTIVPTLAPTLAPVGCTEYYYVKAGDTCWAIANQYTKLGDAFYSLNPNIACGDLKVGQPICIGKCALNQYEVKSGDYCYLIQTTYKLTADQLYAMNPGLDCTALKPGQLVTVGKSNC